MRPPLARMTFRTAELASVLGATYGKALRKKYDKKLKKLVDRSHQGWDLAAPVGTDCYAIADGVVEQVVDKPEHVDYGKFILLRFSKTGNQHASIPGDTFFAQYAHLSSVLVRAGDSVREGQTIGLTGITGNASKGSPHLHFELRTIGDVKIPGGLAYRKDPGEILGFDRLRSE
jgi:murein DD-endopeptidase MepM/ murein hydrolase activator NlpD